MVRARLQLLATAIAAVITLSVGPQAVAVGQPSPAVRCATAKLKAAGQKHGAKVRCYSKALLAGRPVDAACLAAAEASFDAAFVRAEAAGGCATSSDTAAVEGDVDACVGALLQSLVPSAPTTTTVTSTTTTTRPDFSCSPPGSACGSCGCGFCFAPQGSGLTTGLCVVPFAGGDVCSIDPPTPCPPGQTCLITSYDPPMMFCGVLCP